MKKYSLLLSAALFGTLGVMAAGSQTVSAGNTDNLGVCQPQADHLYPPDGTTKSIVVPAPPGMLIKGYCVKAGSENQGDGPVYRWYDPGVESVTITHPSGKDISHYVVFYELPTETAGVEPIEPGFDPPTCDASGKVGTLTNTDGYAYTSATDGTKVTVSVEANEGYVLTGDNVGPWVFETAQLTDGCSADPTPETPTPETPPATPADPQVVASEGPLPPAAAQAVAAAGATAAAPAQTALPATGSTSWALALSALAMLVGGLGLRRLSRRTAASDVG